VATVEDGILMVENPRIFECPLYSVLQRNIILYYVYLLYIYALYMYYVYYIYIYYIYVIYVKYVLYFDYFLIMFIKTQSLTQFIEFIFCVR
jgi:hypothetical protein